MKRTVCAVDEATSAQEPDAKRCKVEEDEQENVLQLDMQEFECIICADLIVDPVVGRCGHDFCKECLEDWIYRNRHKPNCPVCRTSLGSSQEEHGVCLRLKELIEKLFPRRSKDRRKEVEQQTAELKRRRKEEEQRQRQEQEQRRAAYAAMAGGRGYGFHMSGRQIHEEVRRMRAQLEEAYTGLRDARRGTAAVAAAVAGVARDRDERMVTRSAARRADPAAAAAAPVRGPVRPTAEAADARRAARRAGLGAAAAAAAEPAPYSPLMTLAAPRFGQWARSVDLVPSPPPPPHTGANVGTAAMGLIGGPHMQQEPQRMQFADDLFAVPPARLHRTDQTGLRHNPRLDGLYDEAVAFTGAADSPAAAATQAAAAAAAAAAGFATGAVDSTRLQREAGQTAAAAAAGSAIDPAVRPPDDLLALLDMGNMQPDPDLLDVLGIGPQQQSGGSNPRAATPAAAADAPAARLPAAAPVEPPTVAAYGAYGAHQQGAADPVYQWFRSDRVVRDLETAPAWPSAAAAAGEADRAADRPGAQSGPATAARPYLHGVRSLGHHHWEPSNHEVQYTARDYAESRHTIGLHIADSAERPAEPILRLRAAAVAAAQERVRSQRDRASGLRRAMAEPPGADRRTSAADLPVAAAAPSAAVAEEEDPAAAAAEVAPVTPTAAAVEPVHAGADPAADDDPGLLRVVEALRGFDNRRAATAAAAADGAGADANRVELAAGWGASYPRSDRSNPTARIGGWSLGMAHPLAAPRAGMASRPAWRTNRPDAGGPQAALERGLCFLPAADGREPQAVAPEVPGAAGQAPAAAAGQTAAAGQVTAAGETAAAERGRVHRKGIERIGRLGNVKRERPTANGSDSDESPAPPAAAAAGDDTGPGPGQQQRQGPAGRAADDNTRRRGVFLDMMGSRPGGARWMTSGPFQPAAAAPPATDPLLDAAPGTGVRAEGRDHAPPHRTHRMAYMIPMPQGYVDDPGDVTSTDFSDHEGSNRPAESPDAADQPPLAAAGANAEAAAAPAARSTEGQDNTRMPAPSQRIRIRSVTIRSGPTIFRPARQTAGANQLARTVLAPSAGGGMRPPAAAAAAAATGLAPASSSELAEEAARATARHVRREVEGLLTGSLARRRTARHAPAAAAVVDGGYISSGSEEEE